MRKQDGANSEIRASLTFSTFAMFMGAAAIWAATIWRTRHVHLDGLQELALLSSITVCTSLAYENGVVAAGHWIGSGKECMDGNTVFGHQLNCVQSAAVCITGTGIAHAIIADHTHACMPSWCRYSAIGMMSWVPGLPATVLVPTWRLHTHRPCLLNRRTPSESLELGTLLPPRPRAHRHF